MYPAIQYENQRQLLKKIQDTRNIVHRTMTLQSPFKVGTLGPHTVLPIRVLPIAIKLPSHIFLNLMDGLKFLPFQR